MITAHDFLDSANRIYKEAHHEVDYRNSASRAYYAAFHSCKVLVEQTETQFGASHEKVIKALKSDKGKNKVQYQTFGNLLDQLKRIRVNADYQINNPFTRSESEKAKRMSKKLIEMIESIKI